MWAGLAAYERGDFFEAHEVLEPAWMGADDPAERDLHQGLIKLAAAHVHAVRGNRRGFEKNLRGARERLARVVATADAGGPGVGADLDVAAIVAAIDGVLSGPSDLDAAGSVAAMPIPITRRAG